MQWFGEVHLPIDLKINQHIQQARSMCLQRVRKKITVELTKYVNFAIF